MLRRLRLAGSIVCLCGATCFVYGQTTPTLQDKTAQPPAGADAVKDANAPTPDAPASLSIGTNLVNLPVVVRDKKGALIQTLKKDDFALTVDGHVQAIRYFDLDSDVPLTLGLLVDTGGSQRPVLDEERTASGTFLDKMITGVPVGAASKERTPDRAFIIQFARQTELLQDLTDSKPRLQAALKQIGTANPNAPPAPVDPDATGNGSNQNCGNGGGGNNGGSPRGGGYPGSGGGNNGCPTGQNGSGGFGRRNGGKTLYDAVFLSADELLKKQPGRKALIILSDGIDHQSKKSLQQAIERAQKSDTVIYAIYFKGEEPRDSHDRGQNNGGGGYPNGGGGGYPGGGYPGGGGRYPGGGYPGGGYPGGGGGGRGGGQQAPHDRVVDGRKILTQMAQETGGRMFEVSKKQTTAEIYDQIAEELHQQYRLGYTPDEAAASPGYHKVDLTTPKQKGLYVQTREGYYGQ